ncbi:MAG: TRAP transporter fused permease subunit [Dehalococcoidia bacterium]|nr:TRAP transporter fused permease subunit [Dehalococcoidia bacterium]
MLSSEESGLYRPIQGVWYGIIIVLTLIGVGLGLNHIFNLRFFLNIPLLEPSYLYMLLGLFLGSSFLIYPAFERHARSVQWYDVVLASVTIGLCSTFAFKAPDILAEGWEYTAPTVAVIGAAVLVALVLEATRRVTGLFFTGIVIVLGSYPLWAGLEFLPIKGFFLPWDDTIRFHVFSIQSIFGLAAQVVGGLLIGFIVFGVTLFFTGAGTFFVNITMSMLGHVRGGTAKVAIAASGLFGMMSGSSVSNVLSTGTITIPAMKRTGFSATVAAAIEANASSHGSITPPVMGATAFIMAALLQIPYSDVALAAAVPAFLFYYGMFCQIDGYAARARLRGLPKEELPLLWETLKDGWIYLFAITLLIFLMIVLKHEATAPWYTAAVLILLANLKKEKRWGKKQWGDYVLNVARLLTALVPLLGGIGMLVGALNVTGTAGSLTSDLVHLAGNSIPLLLLLGALASFVLGTGLPGTAAYILLAVMMAPTLIKQGLNPLAVHLFLLYWANIADVTPPTAISVVAAAGIANSPIMPTMWEAMKVAAVKYIEPFLFVIAPARILQTNDPIEFITIFASALVGIAAIGYAMQAYLPFVGAMARGLRAQVIQVVLVAAGVAISYPDLTVTLAGGAVSVAVYGMMWFAARHEIRWLIEWKAGALTDAEEAALKVTPA